jgi:DNA-binding HxlR family transcriptional regulator
VRCEPDDWRALSGVLARIANKWAVLVVSLLSAGPMRFNELLRTIGGIFGAHAVCDAEGAGA